MKKINKFIPTSFFLAKPDSFGFAKLLEKKKIAKSRKHSLEISNTLFLLIIIVCLFALHKIYTETAIPVNSYYDPSVELIDD